MTFSTILLDTACFNFVLIGKGMSTKILVNLPVKNLNQFFRKPGKVNGIVCKAVAAGGTTYKEPQDHGFMYGHGFQDLDGHFGN
jgi:predicted lactoylglutathione lyase